MVGNSRLDTVMDAGSNMSTSQDTGKKMRMLVTGANGFVGSALVAHLVETGSIELIAAYRGEVASQTVETVAVGEIGPHTSWRDALEGVNVVVHCAGRAHQIDDQEPDPISAFRLVNVEGTRRLAEEAVASGVKRMVFISSVKVHGEVSIVGRPFREDDILAPTDAYGLSKLEAEEELRLVGKKTGIEIVIIRPPLIYGPSPKANMLRLLRWVSSGVPLPFGSVRNRRSMVSLENLVSGIVAAVAHPAAAGQTYLLSDQEDVSTPDLVHHIADALGRPANMWPVPVGLLRLAGKLAGRTNEVERLVGSLTVDSDLISRQLDWHPVQTIEKGIGEMVDSFRDY